MSSEERRLVRSMHFDKGMAAASIASATGRHISSVCRLLAQRRDPAPVGRPAALTEQQVDRLERILNEMVDEADADYEVTLAMLMKRSRGRRRPM
jgi:transposase